MKKYVEAEKLKREIAGNRIIPNWCLKIVSTVIDSMPAADVEEVRHAKWVKQDSGTESADEQLGKLGYELQSESGWETVYVKKNGNGCSFPYHIDRIYIADDTIIKTSELIFSSGEKMEEIPQLMMPEEVVAVGEYIRKRGVQHGYRQI